MAFAKPRGVSKTLYGQRRLRIGETMGGGGGVSTGSYKPRKPGTKQRPVDFKTSVKALNTKSAQTKADKKTKGQQGKVYDPYNYPAEGKFPAEMNPKRMSFKDEMFKAATTPRRKP
jgi:hypothetical protein